MLHIVGKGNYYGTYEAAYRVTEKSFSKAKITIEMKPTYSGQVICLDSDDITVKLGKEYLVYGRDYEIVADSYQHNVEKGTASVVVRGLGIYGGSKTVKFTIQPKRIQW